VREGPWGVAGMNRAIEERIAGSRRADGRPDTNLWYAGRPIIVTRNDSDAGVFNGDVGIALPGVGGDDGLRVHFGAGPEARSVGVGRLADVETAYAMTVHKAQGSEFAHVAVVLPPEEVRVVTRELLYTGITRSRDAFTLVTVRAASLDEAVARTTRRSSGIGAMLARAAHA
jgi:exodeoxyribonuclease V alpha subunit